MKATCALVQLNFSDNKEANIEHCLEAARAAGEGGAEVICLPELSTSQFFVYDMDSSFFELAEPVPGPASDRFCKLAKELGSWIVFPLYERDGAELYNTATVIDRRGEIVGKYRKNIIPMMRAAGVESLEKYFFRPGNLGYPVFETDLGVTIGITICYERHFPEGPRSLALAGADMILVPTASPVGSDMWEVELRAIAIANQLWVGAVNRVGLDRGERVSPIMEFYGGSLFAAPNGEVVTRAKSGVEDTVYCEIDTERSAAVRREWNFFRDRRPELFGAVSAP